MAVDRKKESRVLKLAVDKKYLSQEDIDECRNLLRKSRRIGLESTLDEILIKQKKLTYEQLSELEELSEMGSGKGSVFGNYHLDEMIGEGGMGKVYRAVQAYTNRLVAIKTISDRHIKESNNSERFFQEIRAMAKLNHPNIVIIYDAGKVKRKYFFAMEYVDGGSLKDYIDKKGRMPEKHALSIISKVAGALDHAHSKNIVHRDIKPENIILGADEEPKVTDFGVVMHKDVDHLTLTQEGSMVGSPYYSSPEQVEGRRDIDKRSDIYSLGASLYHLLSGRPVYTGESTNEVLSKHIAGKWVTPRRYNKHISIGTALIIKKMMAKKREKRFQSMAEVRDSVLNGMPFFRAFKYFKKLIVIMTAAFILLYAGSKTDFSARLSSIINNSESSQESISE
ncbi:MAG: serine/threonine protein kinase [Fibrobacterota bacterium]